MPFFIILSEKHMKVLNDWWAKQRILPIAAGIMLGLFAFPFAVLLLKSLF